MELYSYYLKHLPLPSKCAMMKSRDRVLRLNHLSFRLYSLAALGFSRSGFFMLEIVILQRFSVIVIFILTASLLQIHTDLLNFGSAARPYSLDFLYSITGPTKERGFFSSLQKIFPIFSNFIDKRTCRDFRQVKTCPILYSLKLFSFKNNFLISYSEKR